VPNKYSVYRDDHLHFEQHFACPKGRFGVALHFVSRRMPQNETKEKAPSTWPSASLVARLSAAVPQTRPDKSGLKPRDKLGAGNA